MRIKNLILILFSFVVIQHYSSGQILVQLEIYGEPKATKFGPGSSFTYKTVDSDGEWINDRIERVDYEAQLIIFQRGYEKLENITHLRLNNNFARYLGSGLMQFSVLWLVYGGVTQLVNGDEYAFGWDTLGIGVGAFFTGYVVKKYGGVKIYNVKKRDRLRIVDISWPDPQK